MRKNTIKVAKPLKKEKDPDYEVKTEEYPEEEYYRMF